MRISKFLTAAAVLAAPLFAQATTIDFEDVSTWSHGGFVSNGYDVNLSGQYFAYVVNSQVCGPSCPTNGTNEALIAYEGSVSIAKHGDLFSFNGFDGAGTFNFNQSNIPGYIPNFINVVGTKGDGSQVQESFLIDKTSNARNELNFTTYLAHADFSDLTSLVFSSSGSQLNIFNGLTLDNIVLDSVFVPESSSLMLLGLGLLGLGAARRRTA